MAEGILFGIAEEVLKNLASTALTEVALAWGFKDRLEKLKNTIQTIKNVLLDAEEKQVDRHTIRDWLERLATAVYAADDLFDEVATIASQKQLRGGNKVIKEVHTFFSRSNQIVFAFSISRKIKTIREKLDDIVKDNAEFTSLVVRVRCEWSANSARGRDQTISYVDSIEVIGRDGDKKAILDLLLASSESENEVLQVIPIVGIGGQGKTTLAQLVYNDLEVKKKFKLRLWVCVSEDFNIKEITENILKSATNKETPKLEMEQLQGMLRNEVGDKRYLLILDDVWNDNREEWLKLMALLKNGRKGSKIIVTTRLMAVANIMGTLPPYELQGLQEEKSWILFKKVAFKPGQHQENLTEVGKEIVKKCENVPLAIRAIGSVLYGKDESKWSSLKNRSLVNISDRQNNIMEILKLSYHHLPSPLKNCFAYCALFPKDYEFSKEILIDLWMAEGFIIPRNEEGQGLEELADDYFHFLLQRCFFQDIVIGEWGDIVSCKMHDLIHDLAVQMAGVKCRVAKSNDSYSNQGIHHLSFAYRLTSVWKIPPWMRKLKLLRTILLPQQILYDGSPFSKLICQELISSVRCLRVLDLHQTGVQSLPSSIGKLIHLRYLDLSYTPIRELPDSITNIQNLQTLKLDNCYSLRKLPKNTRKLKDLRIADVGHCHQLLGMPPGLGELTSLIKLSRFIVAGIGYGKGYGKFGDLNTLNNLKGNLHIKITGHIKNPLLEATKANIESKFGLALLSIEFGSEAYDDVSAIDHDEKVFEGLKPHPNIKQLEIYCYKGQKVPSWAMNNLCTNLPNLVEVKLVNCGRCQQVPSFGQLPFLKRLTLTGLHSVEYMETESGLVDLSSLSDSASTESLFFPSLEKLTLMRMDKLEGWWKGGAKGNDAAKEVSHQLTEQRILSMSFSKLSKLRIDQCRKLKFFPLCPSVEELTLLNVNKAISVSKMAASSASASASGSGSKLKLLNISNVEELRSLPREYLDQLCELEVQDENLEGMEEVFTSLSSSLPTLKFVYCRSLRYLGQGLEHLIALENLILWGCEQLDLSSYDPLPWKNFNRLRHLHLHEMPKLLSLPSGLQHLADLHHLIISCNYEFKELPEWISCFPSLGYLELVECPKVISLPDGLHQLTSLNHLHIKKCPHLTERCRAPNGTDWPKIQHIPLVSVLEGDYV